MTWEVLYAYNLIITLRYLHWDYSFLLTIYRTGSLLHSQHSFFFTLASPNHLEECIQHDTALHIIGIKMKRHYFTEWISACALNLVEYNFIHLRFMRNFLYQTKILSLKQECLCFSLDPDRNFSGQLPM